MSLSLRERAFGTFRGDRDAKRSRPPTGPRPAAPPGRRPIFYPASPFSGRTFKAALSMLLLVDARDDALGDEAVVEIRRKLGRRVQVVKEHRQTQALFLHWFKWFRHLTPPLRRQRPRCALPERKLGRISKRNGLIPGIRQTGKTFRPPPTLWCNELPATTVKGSSGRRSALRGKVIPAAALRLLFVLLCTLGGMLLFFFRRFLFRHVGGDQHYSQVCAIRNFSVLDTSASARNSSTWELLI